MQGVNSYAGKKYLLKKKLRLIILKKLFSFLFSNAKFYLTLYLTLMNLEGRSKGA